MDKNEYARRFGEPPEPSKLEKITRYHIGDTDCIEEDDDGLYIRIEDAEELKQRIKELEADLYNANGNLDRMNTENQRLREGYRNLLYQIRSGRKGYAGDHSVYCDITFAVKDIDAQVKALDE